MSKVRYPVLPLLAFFLSLGLYVKTLSPTYIPVDSAEFTLCMHYLGICHPPGFPLYVVLGKIFTVVWPFGSLIYRANLLSAIFGAGTILVIFLSLLELKVNKSIAFLLSIFFAVSSVFWEFSIAADVFTFGAFLVALTFFLVLKNRPLPAFLALGASASHFYISAILAPLLIWYFFAETGNWKQETGNWKQETGNRKKSLLFIVYSLLFFSLGFFPQAILFWRMQAQPEINWGHAQGVFGFIDFVRRKEFGSIFLLSNPALRFSLVKLFKHFYFYFANLTIDFGVILAPLTLLTLIFGGLFKNRRIVFLAVSALILIIVQLTLLSTIDPGGEDNPFQISKFYLSSFVPLVLLMGVSLNLIVEKIFQREASYAVLLLGFLTIVYFLANYKTHDFSRNYFSQNLVLDALSQLPDDSIAITVSHVFYFGGLYEQKINGKFENMRLLYFPNENNRDNEKYHPELFMTGFKVEFVSKVAKDKQLGKAEAYILETISRNLDKPIYILQGTFEEGFFNYLKPYIRPYGLWWRVKETESPADAKALAGEQRDPPTPRLWRAGSESKSIEESKEPLGNLRNGQVKFDELNNKNQQLDLLTYAVAYHSTGVALAADGRYDEALEFLNRSWAVRPKGDNIAKEIELINKTKSLESQVQNLITAKDQSTLTELGNNYYTLGNFNSCADFFSQIVNIDSTDAVSFNNLATCQAARGQIEEARTNYQKALTLDPNLDFAKKGLEELGK